MKNNKKKTEEKAQQIRPRSWVNEEPKSWGGSMIRGWYKANPQYIDESK